jgi:hypothetical protein
MKMDTYRWPAVHRQPLFYGFEEEGGRVYERWFKRP